MNQDSYVNLKEGIQDLISIYEQEIVEIRKLLATSSMSDTLFHSLGNSQTHKKQAVLRLQQLLED